MTLIPRRPYNDRIDLSVIGFPGLAVAGQAQDDANELVAEAIDRGVNYFDVAPSYAEGEAEMKLGIALEGRRDEVFLACKTTMRDAEGAARELETSLARLKTDRFDLYQFHAVTTLEDVERIFGDGGALELFLKAREAGTIGHIGFSAHSVPAALAMLDRFSFDSVLFPINFVCFAQGDFGPQVIERARETGAARLALKSLAGTPWARDAERTYKYCWYQPLEARDRALAALRFTLNEDITAAITPADPGLFRMCLDLADEVTPLSVEEREELLAGTREMEPIFRN